ncbi:MAG TPA: hypothetical protein ENL17_03425 [Candidatus Methanoperedenaceae archaeon]|nr:hypothetical protein [Candidatus Methanoperedenaceae archaeon]
MQKVIRVCLILLLILSLSVPSLCQNNTNKTIETDKTNILMHNPGIFLQDDDTWRFHQGYALTLRDVSDDLNYAWLQLSQNGTIVKDTIVTSGINLTFNRTIGNKTMIIFNMTIKDIYTNPAGNLVILSPVTQYYDPTLPRTTPEPNKTTTTQTTPITPTSTSATNTTPDSTPDPTQPYTLALSALIVLIITIYVLKKL